MRRQTCGRPGRRGTALTASAAVLCLSAALAGCGGRAGGDDGYTAVGAAAAGPEKAPSGAVAPSGKVTLVPLDGAGEPDGGGSGGPTGTSPSPGGSAGAAEEAVGTGAPTGTGPAGPGASGNPDGRAGGPGGTATGGAPSSPSGTGSAGGSTGSSTGGSAGGSNGGSAGGSAGGATGGSTGPASPSTPATNPTDPSGPTGPAVLAVGAPVRAAADERWCEKVTVVFRNTGGSPARSGTVTFATHIIGGAGIDWATRTSTAPLPVPIGAGAARKMTFTVCVDAWRVPLGMRVETRDVTAVWK